MNNYQSSRHLETNNLNMCMSSEHQPSNKDIWDSKRFPQVNSI